MKKTVIFMLVILCVISLCSCTDKTKREHEFAKQQYNQAQENLKKIDEAQKQSERMQDLLDQYKKNKKINSIFYQTINKHSKRPSVDGLFYPSRSQNLYEGAMPRRSQPRCLRDRE